RLVREAVAWPDLTIGGATFDWVSRALNECARLSRIPSPEVPMLVSLGSEEKVVSPQAIRDRAARWPQSELLEIAGARHEILMETDPLRERFYEAMLARFDAS
ncbi:MAG: alpha/beta hydrolase, partial [Paracoccaceae bacterium]